VFVRYAANLARLIGEPNTTHDLVLVCIFLCHMPMRDAADRIRSPSLGQGAGVTAPFPWIHVRRPTRESSSPDTEGGLQLTVRLNRCRKRRLIIRTACRVARVGRTTPMQVESALSPRW
jgi:hypothetical protein